MRVDESWQARVCMSVSSTLIALSNEQWELHESWRESFFFFLVFARCFPASFSSFFDACQTADSPSHYSNCHLSMIRNNIFFFLWVTTWKSPASATLYDSRATLMTGQTSQTSHWLSSKFEPAQSWWECMRVGGQTRARVATLVHSHPRLIRP